MLNELEKIDWLICSETEGAKEEDLDLPYAYLDRIYTRREFEKTAEEGCALYSACQKKRAEKRAAVVHSKDEFAKPLKAERVAAGKLFVRVYFFLALHKHVYVVKE